MLRRAVILLLLAVAIGAAAWIRWVEPHQYVLTPARTVIPGIDTYYHARVVDSMVAHWPQMLVQDSFLGQHPLPPPVAPFFPFIVATFALILGRGAPSPATVNLAIAWAPLILGALTVIPVWGIARRLWGELAGLVAGGAIALLPGEFLKRSILGYSDHHVVEVLFSTTLLLCLVMAMPRTSNERAAASSPSERGRQRSKKGKAQIEAVAPATPAAASNRWTWPIAAGVAMAAYLLAWRSAGMILVLPFAWGVMNPFVDRRDRRPLEATAIAFGVASALMIAAIPWSQRTAILQLAVSGSATAVLGSLLFLDRWATARTSRPRLVMLVSIVVLSVAAIAASEKLTPNGLLTRAEELRGRFTLTEGAAMVREVRPFLSLGPGMQPFTHEFAAMTWTAAIGLALLVWRMLRRPSAAEQLIGLCTAGVFLATLGQNRFTYYLAVEVALLTGLAAAWGAGELSRSGRSAPRTVVTAAICLVAIASGIAPARAGTRLILRPVNAWFEAFDWLRNSTPSPFVAADVYTAAPRHNGDAPEASYTVLAWWDYGYWLIREAHRVPVTNPSQVRASEVAKVFIEQDDATTADLARSLGARYTVTDWRMLATLNAAGALGDTGYVPAMALWAETPSERYFEAFIQQVPNAPPREYYLFYPDYFRTAAVRLALYGGRAARAENIVVVTFNVVNGPDGKPAKNLLEAKEFHSEEEAASYAAAAPEGTGRRIVSTSPYETCVSIPPSSQFRLRWQSPEQLKLEGRRTIPGIRIFEIAD